MGNYYQSDPGDWMNEAARDVTEMQLKDAQEIASRAGLGTSIVPALLVALAINKQTLQQQSDAR